MGPLEFVQRIAGDQAEWRLIKKKKCVAVQHGGDPPNIPGADVYFKVGPGWAWVDLDFKTNPTPDLGLVPPPTATVRTGGGLHLYWRIDNVIDDAEQRSILRGLCTAVGGDPASAEPARILRAPGTLNQKYSPPRPCELESADWDLSYESWQLPHEAERIAETMEGELTTTELRGVLAAIDASDFSEYEDWIRIMSACHKATGGSDEGKEVFAEWSSTDFMYPEGAESARAKWTTFDATRPGGAGVGTLRKALADRGRGDVWPSKAEEGEFAAVANESAPAVPQTVIELLNASYFPVDESGQLRVYTQRPNPQLGTPEWVRYPKVEFVNVVQAVHGLGQLQLPGSKKYLPASLVWLDWPWAGKRTFDGTTFDPDGPPFVDRSLNLWTGLVPPVPGDTSLWEEMVTDVLCAGDLGLARYVFDWVALSILRPAVKPGTVLVIHGPQGTGKSLFGTTFAACFGSHGMVLSNPGQVTGRFNDHLRTTVGLFVDEAFWSGDKAAEGVLKALITEGKMTFEAKYKNPVLAKSYARLVVATNNDRAFNVSDTDERRAVVLRTGARKSVSFYSELAATRKLLPSWLVAWAACRDVSQFNPMASRPRTTGWEEQAARSMDPTTAWIHEFIADRYVNPMVEGLGDSSSAFTCRSVQDAIAHAHGRLAMERSFATVVGMTLTKLLSVTVNRFTIRGERTRCYVFPTPETASERFYQATGIRIQLDSEQIW